MGFEAYNNDLALSACIELEQVAEQANKVITTDVTTAAATASIMCNETSGVGASAHRLLEASCPT